MCISLRFSLAAVLCLICLYSVCLWFQWASLCQKKSTFRSRTFLDALKVPLLPQGGVVTTTTHLHASNSFSIGVPLVAFWSSSTHVTWIVTFGLVSSIGSLINQRALHLWSRSRIKVLLDPFFLSSLSLYLLSFLLHAVILLHGKEHSTVNCLLNCGKASCCFVSLLKN